MGQFFEGWIASESQDHDAIKVKRLYVDINDGNWYDAAMFSQIMYWNGFSRETGKRRLTIFRDGFFWLAKRYDDWWNECRVNAKTARNSIERMITKNLLIKEVWLFEGKPMIHLRINIEVFEILANHAISEAKESSLILPNREDGYSLIGRMDTPSEGVSITETTAENQKRSVAPEKGDDVAPETTAAAKPSRPRNEMYDAVEKVWGYTAARNAAYCKLLQGIPNKHEQFKNCQLEKPITPTELLLWAKWYRDTKLHGDGKLTMVASPSKVQSSIAEWQRLGGVSAPTPNGHFGPGGTLDTLKFVN